MTAQNKQEGAHQITMPVAFDPARLSTERRALLDDLLGRIEVVAAARQKFLNTGRMLSLRAWFSDPESCRPNPDIDACLSQIPDERFLAVVNEGESIASSTDDHALCDRFNEMTMPQQRAAFSYISSRYADYLDRREDLSYWKSLTRFYGALLKLYPDILNRQEDIDGAVRLGRIMDERKDDLGMIWQSQSKPAQIDVSRSILREAWPDDRVDHLHIAPVKTTNVVAAVIQSVAADTLLLGEYFFKMKRPDLPLYLLGHEFQHRRQSRLANTFKTAAEGMDDASRIQGRLFLANMLRGGYLSPVMATNKLNMAVKISDYLDQPAEVQADMIAALASDVADNNGAGMWKIAKAQQRIISAAATPINAIVEGAMRLWPKSGTGPRP